MVRDGEIACKRWKDPANCIRRFAQLLGAAAETAMIRLGSEVKRNIFRLSLQGYNIVEISERLGYYERGVERVRAEIRSLLEAMMVDDRPAYN